MAYATIERNRPATLVAVAALHVGVIYALVTGLAGPAWIADTVKPFVGVNIPLPKPPPETTETKPAPDRNTRSANDLKNTGPIADTFPTGPVNDEVNFKLPPIGDDFGSGGIGDPLPPFKPPVETFAPRLAKPVGKPGLWVTPNDYPSNDLRAEHEGTTRFQLSIGTDGKVQSCEVTVSSGFASLDKAACDNLRKRAKFIAATDTNGTAVPATYSSAVQWKIPKDY